MPERHKRQEGAWQSHMRPGQEPFSPVLLETVLRAPGTIMVGPSYRVRENLRDNSRILPGDDELSWRIHVRIQPEAALCHDIGNLPFSHAAEKELLPPGWSHEHLAVELIKEMEPLWEAMTPPLRTSDVLKIAVGPKKLSSERCSDGEAILSEIIVRDALGADRIDYLLRDSYHAGVAYGRFDHYRLIDTMRILPKGEGDSMEPRLGVEIGGLPSAEALLLARYFMYAQVYCHPVRRAYDMHLKSFLREWVDKEEVMIGS